MKQGQKTTQSDLLNDGWKQVDCFGYCEIWSKGSDRLLWNPATHIIEIYYDINHGGKNGKNNKV